MRRYLKTLAPVLRKRRQHMQTNNNNSKSTTSTSQYEGRDNQGSLYKSIHQFWSTELENADTQAPLVNKIGDRKTWFEKGNQYWTNSDATYDGVLGGYGKLSQPDIMYSLKFMLKLFEKRPQTQRNSVLDCGAGIGRITKQLLANIYQTVDLNDQCNKYVQAAKQHLKGSKKVRHFINKGLQDLQFTEKYDCVWVQWVLCYLPDKEAVEFLEKAKKSLNPGGVVILKQNHCGKGFDVDKADCSVTRSRELYVELMQKAGLKIILEGVQTPWPNDLFEVRMYAAADKEQSVS